MVGLLPAMEEGEERHDEARRAEAALRAVGLDQRLLDGVEIAVAVRQVLDGDQLLAVERRHELDAGIDRAIAEPVAVELAEHHRAGAAIALGAALLGAAAPLDPAQILEHGHRRIDRAELAEPAAEQEPDAVAHAAVATFF